MAGINYLTKNKTKLMWFRLKNWFNKNRYLIAILFLAVCLLVFRISYRTFWGDEMAVLDYLKESPLRFLVNYWQRPDNHPPLYYFLVLLVSKILPWSEIAIRSVSALAGLGIVYLVYLFTQRVSGEKKMALLAAFFTAVSSYFILISQMARYHSLAGLFSLMAFYFFYCLFTEGYSKRAWYGYLVSLVLTGYTDYPHFFYVGLIVNLFYLYSLIKKQNSLSLLKWIIGHFVAAFILSPLVWMIYNRIALQGDGGWNNTNLLANSWFSIVAAIFFHIYSFFFGENIFPWNYFIFGIGVVVLLGVLFGFARGFQKKLWTARQLFIIMLSVALIVINTFFMNVADPRYNFIVYPKFGFVAYPLWVMVFVLCINKLPEKIKNGLLFSWLVVSVFGLYNFYQAKNYLNPSYFRNFTTFTYVQNNSQDGQYLAITPNASQGFYEFYQNKYFIHLKPLQSIDISNVKKETKVWFLSASSEGTEASMNTETVIPEGYKILERYDDVPLDSTFKKVKEKILHRPSYIYKYSVFLLEKI